MQDDKPSTQMTETWAEEVARLGREIAERQRRLQQLICGDPRVRVEVPNRLPTDIVPWWF